MMAPRVAIIGGGCAGTLVAAQLLRQAREALEVVLVERRGEAGPGVAYSTPLDDHRLNVPAARMSAWPEEPDHFLNWARAAGPGLGWNRAIQAGDFLPRRLYGRYLADVLRRARQEAAPGAVCNIVAGEAIDLSRTAAGGRVTLADGGSLDADAVVLAIGILPGEYPLRRPLPFYHGQHYLHSPWAPGALASLRTGDHLLIVGAGLTAVDILVHCHAAGHTGTIHALSRNGLRPQAHGSEPAPYPPFIDAASPPATIRETVSRVRAEVRLAAARGGDWRAVVDAVRPVSQALWEGFSWGERARFMRHVRPFWEVHRHRIAPAVAAIVQEMEAAGRVKFHAGRVTTLMDTKDGAAAVIKLRGSEDFLALRIDKVINCTGPRTDYTKYQHPLLINLLADGLIGHDPLALGISALPTGEVLRYDGSATGWLFTLGAPLKGTLWESTAVPEIRAQAAALARRLLHDLPGRAAAIPG